MDSWLVWVIGLLYGVGSFLILSGSLVKFVFGLSLLSHGANLLIFLSPGLVRGGVPILSPRTTETLGRVSDPLAQAMILTAIVIGFGVLAFVLALVRRAQVTANSDESDAMRQEEP